MASSTERLALIDSELNPDDISIIEHYDSNNTTPFQSVDDAIDAMGFGAFQWNIFFLAGMGVFVEAMETAFHGIFFPQIKAEWELNNYDISTMMTFQLFGTLMGALVLGRISDKVSILFYSKAISISDWSSSSLSTFFVHIIDIRFRFSFGANLLFVRAGPHSCRFRLRLQYRRRYEHRQHL